MKTAHGEKIRLTERIDLLYFNTNIIYYLIVVKINAMRQNSQTKQRNMVYEIYRNSD